MFDRYNIVSDGDLREAVLKLAAKATGTKWGQWAFNGPADSMPILAGVGIQFANPPDIFEVHNIVKG